MNKINFIENVLIEYGIFNYKIIKERLTKVIFSYKCNNKKILENANLINITLNFKINKNPIELKLSEETSYKNIKKLIETALLFGMHKNFISKKIKSVKLDSLNFNGSKFLCPRKCINDLETDIDYVLKNCKLKLNATIEIKILQQLIIISNKRIQQQIIHIEGFFYKSDNILENFFISFFNPLKNSISYLLQKQISYNKVNFLYKNLDLSKPILFKSNVVAEFLNQYIIAFYSNNVYFENSFIKTKDINNKIFNFNFDLVSLPFNGIKYDSQGFKTKKIYLIKENYLKNLICNQYFSDLLNILNPGNADLFNYEAISHQRLKIIPKLFILKQNYDEIPIVYSSKILRFDIKTTRLLADVLFCYKNKHFRAKIFTSLNLLFEKSIFSKKNSTNNNVICRDMLVNPKFDNFCSIK